MRKDRAHMHGDMVFNSAPTKRENKRRASLFQQREIWVTGRVHCRIRTERGCYSRE